MTLATILLAVAVFTLAVLLAFEMRARRAVARELASLQKAHDASAMRAEQTRAALAALQSAVGFDGDEGTADLIAEMRTIKGLLKKMTDRSAAVRERAEGTLGRGAAADAVTEKLTDAQVLDIVRGAIEGNRVDLYLQPIVTLPQRKVRFYEAFGRIRTEKGTILLPDQYRAVATEQGLLPTIANLLLFRCVQSVRRPWRDKLEVGFFCNLSRTALLDPEFFPQFVEFLERNKDLAESLIFELPQEDAHDAALMANLATLRTLSFAFSEDNRHLVDDGDLTALTRAGFRYVKINAAEMLAQEQTPRTSLHVADWAERLKRGGMELIAEKVEEDAQAVRLMELNVTLAQGYLFGEPRPLRERT
jgi:cyclic-di-GMP phosphodiesterase TipF (flagellum assembly factor)